MVWEADSDNSRYYCISTCWYWCILPFLYNRPEMKANGNNQMNAAMKVLPKYQKEILAVMSPEMKEKMMQAQLGSQGKFNPNGTIRK